MLIERINVNQNERAIVSRKGRFVSILTPGTYWFLSRPWMSIDVEVHALVNPAFRSRWERHLIRNEPNVVAAHFHVIETKDSEIAMVFVDGMLHRVLLPGERVLFWRDAASVSAEFVTVIDSDLPEPDMTALEEPEYGAEIDYLFSEP